MILWVTGSVAAGKSTMISALEAEMPREVAEAKASSY